MNIAFLSIKRILKTFYVVLWYRKLICYSLMYSWISNFVSKSIIFYREVLWGKSEPILCLLTVNSICSIISKRDEKHRNYNMGWQLCNANDQILAWKQFWWMAVVDGHTFAFSQSFQNALPLLTVIYLGTFHLHSR